jgi:hypothetical protein
MKIKQHRYTEEVLRFCGVLVLGIAMYLGALGLEQNPGWQSIQKASQTNAGVELSTKKTCIMLAWQEQSARIDRETCARYTEQRRGSRELFADSR